MSSKMASDRLVRLVVVLIAIAIFVIVGGRSAADVTWNGGNDIWGNPVRWNVGVPAVTDDVSISTRGNQIAIEATYAVSRLTLDGPQTSLAMGGIVNFTTTNGLTVSAALTNPGDASVFHQWSSGTLDVGGVLAIGGGNVTQGPIYVGEVVQDRGWTSAQILTLGAIYANSNGSYRLTGSGKLAVGTNAWIGASGTGTFTQNGVEKKRGHKPFFGVGIG